MQLPELAQTYLEAERAVGAAFDDQPTHGTKNILIPPKSLIVFCNRIKGPVAWEQISDLRLSLKKLGKKKKKSKLYAEQTVCSKSVRLA